MEKPSFEQIPKKEQRCDICGEAHPTYEHKGKVDIEARRKSYVRKLIKGRPAEIEEQKEKIIEGTAGFSELQEKAQEKLMKGKKDFETLKAENIRKLRESGYKEKK